MEKTLSVPYADAIQQLVTDNVLRKDESYLIGYVTYEDGTVMDVLLYGTLDGTFLQGVINGLGNDETKDVTDTLEVDGYMVRLIDG